MEENEDGGKSKVVKDDVEKVQKEGDIKVTKTQPPKSDASKADIEKPAT